MRAPASPARPGERPGPRRAPGRRQRSTIRHRRCRPSKNNLGRGACRRGGQRASRQIFVALLTLYRERDAVEVAGVDALIPEVVLGHEAICDGVGHDQPEVLQRLLGRPRVRRSERQGRGGRQESTHTRPVDLQAEGSLGGRGGRASRSRAAPATARGWWPLRVASVNRRRGRATPLRRLPPRSHPARS